MLSGWLVVEEKRPKNSERQLLVVANNEDEARAVSEFDLDKIAHVIKWDGRRKFWYGEGDFSIGEYLSRFNNKPHIIDSDMYCDVDHLLRSKKNKKTSITLDEAIKEIKGIIYDTDEGAKVPNEIKDAIRKAAEYRAKASAYEVIIERWFDAIGVSENEGFRDTYIDCIQQSYNPEEAIRHFENMID
ncbi:hypothetical protein [Paenibacillus donghaensis]|uniref:Uncharacterized protein n=1 Tax=Paenibacillus donghaensis TaxID=414771 RepID=A0A2Z2KAV3_9BACL|nr:hypothetical protein [Paenibacillus donghaensis]ASA22637.1 hypothetical protein B9T62_18695 [Paenibacillus donghaensis]